MYRATYYDPLVWVSEDVVQEFETVKEARAFLDDLIKKKPT